MSAHNKVEVEGWLVIIDYKLFLIPENYSENYENGDRIEISIPELIFAVIEKIFPLGGGRSFIFHRAKISGNFIDGCPEKIVPETLSVQERGNGFVDIDISSKNIEKQKASYIDFLKTRGKVSSLDWLDYI